MDCGFRIRWLWFGDRVKHAVFYMNVCELGWWGSLCFDRGGGRRRRGKATTWKDSARRVEEMLVCRVVYP